VKIDGGLHRALAPAHRRIVLKACHHEALSAEGSAFSPGAPHNPGFWIVWVFLLPTNDLGAPPLSTFLADRVG
jgi:hypothetical protein